MKPTQAEVVQAIHAATGRAPGTLLLRRARLVNVLSGEIYVTDILLAGRLIAGVGSGYHAEREIDLNERYVIPGLIDGHLHLESSLVEPREYARAVVPRGVTAVVADPHEIANVLGLQGIEYMLKATDGLPLDVFLTASSCVPATQLETSGARITPSDIDQLLAHPRVVGVAELMNFPGMVAAEPDEVQKALLAEAHGKVADGHAPLLRGKGLNGYLAAGISSDHESSALEEALDKLRLGVTVMIREGSAARNLQALLPLIRAERLHQICFVTDDRHPHDLIEEGGVDHLVRRAIAAGVDPTTAIRLGSLNTARHFRLNRRGAIAPGYIADIVVLEDLNTLTAAMVFKSGRLVARDSILLEEAGRYADPSVLQTVHLPALTPESIRLPHSGGTVCAIELVPGEILTRAAAVMPKVIDGRVQADPEQDLAKLVVVERHGKVGSVGVGLVKGFGLKRGAIASTVGHDSHNLTIAGVDDESILTAARTIGAMQGGFCAVAGTEELARLPLPIAGLMSTEPLEAVRDALDRLEAAAGQLGVKVKSPFMTLSFLALAVIPEVRLTDRGLVSVGAGGVQFVKT